MALIPTGKVQHCISDLEALYKKWRNLKKHSEKKAGSQKEKQTIFVSSFNDLFAIARVNEFAIMTIENYCLVRKGKQINLDLWMGLILSSIMENRREMSKSNALKLYGPNSSRCLTNEKLVTKMLSNFNR